MAKSSKSNPHSLLTALDFIAPVMEKKGTLSDTHCSLSNHFASAFNGLIGMGHPIQEDLIAYPCYAPLRAALAQSKDGCSITVKDTGNIFISAPPFRANVKGVKVNQINATTPDACIVALDDSFRASLAVLDKVIKEEDDNAAKCSLLVQSGSLIATDGVIFLEYWHGFSLPTLMLPKDAVSELAKIKQPLTGFGFTANRSATFYFGQAWFKTQLIDAKYPDLTFITSLPVSPEPVPVGLSEAIKAVRAHSEDDEAAVYFGNGQLQSHVVSEEGAIYEVAGLAQGPIYNSKYLALVVELATGIDFAVDLRGEKIAGFVGDRIRGVLMPRGR